MDAGCRQRNDAGTGRFFADGGIGARLFAGVVSRRRVVPVRRHVSRRGFADVFSGSGVARRRHFAALFADVAVADQKSRVFTHVSVVFADVSVLFADVTDLFAHFAVVLADQPQIQSDVAEIQSHFAAVQSDVAVLFTDVAVVFAD